MFEISSKEGFMTFDEFCHDVKIEPEIDEQQIIQDLIDKNG